MTDNHVPADCDHHSQPGVRLDAGVLNEWTVDDTQNTRILVLGERCPRVPRRFRCEILQSEAI